MFYAIEIRQIVTNKVVDTTRDVPAADLEAAIREALRRHPEVYVAVFESFE